MRPIDDDRVEPVGRRGGDHGGDVAGHARGGNSADRNAKGLPERLELLDRRGPVDVGRDEDGVAALPAQDVRELRDGGRLARALKADERDDGGRPVRPHEWHGLAAQHVDEGVVDDLDDHLSARDGFHHPLADGALPHRRHELADDLEVDVRFEQRDADVTERFVQVGVGDMRAALELFERRG